MVYTTYLSWNWGCSIIVLSTLYYILWGNKEGLAWCCLPLIFRSTPCNQPTNLHWPIHQPPWWLNRKKVAIYPTISPLMPHKISISMFLLVKFMYVTMFNGSQKSPFPLPQWKSFSWVYQCISGIYSLSLSLSIAISSSVTARGRGENANTKRSGWLSIPF